MDMKQLKCFAVAVEAGSFTRASEQMHIAQSAFSRQISNLESELGVPLFIRKGRGVELSAEGSTLYDRACKLLSDFEAFQRGLPIQEWGQSARKVVVAAHGGLGPAFLPKVAKLVRMARKPVQFSLREMSSEKIEKQVSAGECDIGIVIRQRGFKVERADLETIKLGKDSIFAVGASEDGGLIGEVWSAEAALKKPLILALSGSLERASIENWARERNIVALDIAGEAHDVPARLELARQLNAFCILPGIGLVNLLANGNWQTHLIQEDDLLNGSEWFVIYRRTEEGRLIRDIADVIHKEAALLLDSSGDFYGYLF
jgi:DNA-binding transcriptional LysR family regulator